MVALPSGPRGRVLAVGLTLAVLGLVWLGAMAPLLAWRMDLADTRVRSEILDQRMAAVAATRPSLQAADARAAVEAPAGQALIEGATDAVAAALVQEQVQDMARKAGVVIGSAEALPAEPVGRYRRIGLRVAVTGGLPVLTQFLQAIGHATPRLLVDDLQMQRSPVVFGGEKPLQASFVVFGLRNAPS